jgi:hypothetical protein
MPRRHPRLMSMARAAPHPAPRIRRAAEAPPAGAHQCIERILDNADDCSITPYPIEYIFYKPDEIEDTRGCTPCSCELSMDSDCSVSISAYQDLTCSEKSLIATGVVSLTDVNPQCHDVMPGAGLQSMMATVLTDKPGTCQASGGEPVGEVKVDPLKAHVFCCQEPWTGQ